MAHLRTTHTCVTLDISEPAFREIERKLRAADYGHCFSEDRDRTLIDMTGIAVASDGSKPRLMRDDHWVMLPGDNEFDGQPVIVGVFPELRKSIAAAARSAIRACTANGTEIDFDPDAMVMEICSRLCGYQANLGRLESR
jgi:hypothetical protein